MSNILEKYNDEFNAAEDLFFEAQDEKDVTKFNKAKEMYKDLAEKGFPEAQLVLGFLYLNNGLGEHNEGEVWLEKAVESYRKLAEEGIIQAQLRLVDLYEHGYASATCTLEEAIMWCEKAASQGSEAAKITLESLKEKQSA